MVHIEGLAAVTGGTITDLFGDARAPLTKVCHLYQKPNPRTHKKPGGRRQLLRLERWSDRSPGPNTARPHKARSSMVLWWDSQAGGLTAAGTPLDWPY